LLRELRTRLRPSRYEDYVDQVRAELFQVLLFVVLGILALSFLVSSLRPDRHVPTIVFVYGLLFALHAISLWLVRGGRLRPAAVLYSSVVWLLVTGLVFLYGGLSGQHAATLIACVLIAGFCAGGGWGSAFAALTMAALSVVAVFEVKGWLPVPLQVSTPYDRLQSLGVATVLAAMLVGIAMHELRRSLVATHERELALQKSLEEQRSSQRLNEVRARQGGALGRLGQVLSRSGGAGELFDHAAAALLETAAVERVAIFVLRAPDRMERVAEAWVGLPGEPMSAVLEGGARAAVERALPGDREVLLADPESDALPLRAPGGFRTLFVDIRGRDARLGVIVAHVRATPELDELDRLFCGTVAGMLASAMERERAETERSQAQRMEAVGRLASSIAHDFNNLLTGTIGAADLLALELPEKDPNQELVQEILLASDRAALLTRRLLAFTGKPAAPTRVELNTAVRDFEPMLRRLIGERIALRVDTCAEPLPVLADRGNLDQVLLNLAVNARDAIGGQDGQVFIATGLDADAEGDHAVLSIRDTGQGMDESTQGQVFEPFFTTKAPGKGTGIGLSTVRTIVTDLRGTIEVASRPGQGATFRVRLPLIDDATDREVRGRMPVAAGDGARILLVEDNERVRATTEKTLRGAGYEVVSAANGREALLRFDEGPPFALVLSDVVMPEMGGAEFRSRLAQRQSAPPLVLMSGFADADLQANGASRDADLLAKPFTRAALLERVGRAIAAGSGRVRT
jgi:signal transduction histidine kinase